MPKVIGYTPPWLTRPFPGYEMFASKATPSAKETASAQKTIATRGSEIFVAVGREIRWADLAQLKEAYGANNANMSSSRSRRLANPTEQASYRTLKVSVPLPITRLAISPYGNYMAVCTSHTVHVVILPDSNLLDSDDLSPIKPKSFQVGETAHVLEQSPIASVLWHPLGYCGRCLVTITREGVVRLWELNRADRSTFSEPTLSINLVKLANATSAADDLSATMFGKSKGFSPDSAELEVASACFGDYPDQEGVHGWAPQTLWIAMIEGDVYALCPLLPSKWQLGESPGATTFLETLATSINTYNADILEESDATPEDKETAQNQLGWLSDLTYQEPFRENLPSGDVVKVFTRPTSVPAVPFLQGPFNLIPDVDYFELRDIIVFSLKTFSDGMGEGKAEGSPSAAVCLLTDTSKVHIYLDLEGIVGRWLPATSKDGYTVSESPEHKLVLTETIALTNDEASSSGQSITADVHTDFSFFVSHSDGVFYVSLESWVRKLENELSEPQTEGSEFRIQRLLEAASTQVEHCIQRPQNAERGSEEVTSCVVLEDGNIGYLVLTTISHEPYAVVLDAPEYGIPTEEELAQYMSIEAAPMEMRPIYQPPKELYEDLQLLAVIDRDVPARHKAFLKDEIRLSPANLELLMTVHKVLSHFTQRLQSGVADLFRRCERLQDEFKDQIIRTAQLATKIDSAIGNDEVQSDTGSEGYGNAKIEERLNNVKARQQKLNTRYEAIRRRMANIGGPGLSEKEASLLEELSTMECSIDKHAQTLTNDVDGSETPAWLRLEQVKDLKEDLSKEVEEMSRIENRKPASGGVKVPSQVRKLEEEQIEALLERETALVEAAINRLRSMGISIATER
ncbi:hypothetical protein CC78DRAFT_464197 [Lojkania enalia]|uniref:Nuclear pore complex protein An-Nup82 n=1 Tax=Lojkania enalia TaxID=147567 RepID=A0A9P4KAM8_9PLEO|nr:hypothetical protein CC78DRAFT_464197 [Didymosphaeria enalia]